MDLVNNGKDKRIISQCTMMPAQAKMASKSSFGLINRQPSRPASSDTARRHDVSISACQGTFGCRGVSYLDFAWSAMTVMSVIPGTCVMVTRSNQ